MATKIVIAAVAIFEFISLLSAVGTREVYEHDGSFLTWQVNNTDPGYLPVNLSSTAIKVIFKFTRSWTSLSNPCKANASSSCSSTSVMPLLLYFGSSNTSQPNYARHITPQVTCQKYTGDSATIIGYSQSVFAFPVSHFYRIKFSGCCWNSKLNDYSSSSYNSETVIHFPKIDQSQNYNSPVQLRFFPEISITDGEATIIQFPVYDIDGDYISCRWASDFAEGGGIYNARIGTLNKQACSLTVNSFIYMTGHYALAIVMEDFNDSTMAVKYHSVLLQFTVNIKGASPEMQIVNCSTINNQNEGLLPVSPGIMPTSAPPASKPFLNTVGCNNYKTLSLADRSVSHNDWSSYRSDTLLYGWYRFTGNAGDSILSTCPALASALNNACGSYYKGWLNNQQLPTFQEGAVNRSACFSPPGSCICSYERSIKVRNCSGFYVYYLDGVPKHNARYCSNKDPPSTVYCSENYLRIDLARSRYNASDYSSITLLQDSCNAILTSSHISLGTRPDSCGTTARHASTFIVFENKAVLKAKTIAGLIRRHSDLSIKFSCIFPSDAFIGSSANNITTEVSATEPGFGQFKLFLHMYLNSQYAQQYSTFPVSVQLRERLYFEASTTARSNFIVLIDKCYSTPVNNSNDRRKFVFVNERCSVGNDAQFHPSVRSKQRFSILASNLLNNEETAYVNCLVFLCHHQSNETRCNTGCQGNNLKRTARAVQSNVPIYRPSISMNYLVQVGAIKKEKDQTGKCQTNPCKNGGTCNLANGKCTCITGLTGATCETRMAALNGTIIVPFYSYKEQPIDKNSPQRIKNDLSNKSSSMFIEMVLEIQPGLLRKFQAAIPNVDNVIITKFSVGSLIIGFDVIFKKQIDGTVLSLEKTLGDAINGTIFGQITILRLTDVDECSKTGYCDANAICTNHLSSFACTCKSNYEGNGFTCTKKKTDYTGLAIGLSFGAVFLILVFLLLFFIWRGRNRSQTYEADGRLNKLSTEKDASVLANYELEERS